MRRIALIALGIVAALSAGANAAHVRDFEYRGLKLGMSVAKAQASVGGTISEKRSDEYNLLMEYEIEVSEGNYPDSNESYLDLMFDRYGRLYYIFDKQKIYGNVNLKKLFERYSKKFGPPTPWKAENYNISDDDSNMEVIWRDPSCTRYCVTMTVAADKRGEKGNILKTEITVAIIDKRRYVNNQADIKRALQNLKDTLENQIKM